MILAPLFASIAYSLSPMPIVKQSPPSADIWSLDSDRNHPVDICYTDAPVIYRPLTTEEKIDLHRKFMNELKEDFEGFMVMAYYAYKDGNYEVMYNFFSLMEGHDKMMDIAHRWAEVCNIRVPDPRYPIPHDMRMD